MTTVTGSSGFIGSHLMKKIDAVGLGHEDIPYANTPTFDRLFFLSTYGNMAHHTDHGMMIRANIEDLIRILKGFGGWICFMSSSSVLLPVQTPYSRTKLAAEHLLQSLPELKSCIVRPYSVTGVGEQKEHLIPTLIRSCMEGVPMDFDASPVHDFVDVEDVVNGLIRLADEQSTGIHEFGSGWSHSNQDVLELVETACGKKANIQSHRRMREYDNQDWCCKIPSPLFKHPKTFYQSIEEMVEEYKRAKVQGKDANT